ncbi:MAG: DUF2304 domain-containing protein [Chitinophagales bacterium]
MNYKLLLLIPVAILFIIAIPRLKNRTFYRLLILSMTLLGGVFVVFPGLTDRIANFVGVARGFDLLVYLFIMFFFVAGIILYSKIRNLEAEHTELVRKIAINRVEKIEE